MLVTMSCTCGAELQLEIPQTSDTMALMWSQRFIDAHTKCGFMAPLVVEAPQTSHTIMLPIKDGDN